MSRICRIVLICEGWRDSAFARSFLAAAKTEGVVDAKVSPGGSGYDWVKTQFVEEVANLGRFSEGRGVLGLIDEDGQGIAERQREVADKLKARELPPISAPDGRCLLLPTRNMETWLYWLTAQRVGLVLALNETTDYKKTGPPTGVARIGDGACRPAGEYLHTLNHTKLPPGCPPMLGQALAQLRQFLSAVRR